MNYGREFHGYLNDDGTYHVTILSEATKDGILGSYIERERCDTVIDMPRAEVKFKLLANKDDEETIWTITIGT